MTHLLRKILLKIRHTPSYVWRVSVCAILFSSIGVAWNIPASHRWLGVQLGLEPVVVEASSGTENQPDVALSERVQNLEGALSTMQQEQKQNTTTMQQLHDDFQKAVAEVAQTNDQLQKQAEQLNKIAKSVTAPKVPSGSTAATSTPTPTGKLNINSATVDQFDALPGIGPTYAQRIIDYRTQHGPFKTVDELDNVSGIGPSTLDKIRDLVEI